MHRSKSCEIWTGMNKKFDDSAEEHAENDQIGGSRKA